MSLYLQEWLTFIVRWLHVIIAAVWIGTSFYLFSWDNKFNRKDMKADIEGNFWTIQGGDFYYIEKLKRAPKQLPEELHWFKYEAYLTWISGFFLLCFLYYIDASYALIKTSAVDISPLSGLAISMGSLVLSWIFYDQYCKFKIAGNLPLSALIGLVAVAILAILFSMVFTGRAVFLHVGTVMGTIMSANVFFVIIPWHKALVAAIEEGESLDTLYQRHPGLRSDHNHYMALPVFLTMVSGHLPVAFSHPYRWLILTVVVLAAGMLKHFHTKQQQKQGGLPYLVIAVFLLSGVIFASRPGYHDPDICSTQVSMNQIYDTVFRHCSSCHSATPADPVFAAPPNGVVFDTSEQIYFFRDRILTRVVINRTMPPVNKSRMLPEERQLFKCWIDNGARTE